MVAALSPQPVVPGSPAESRLLTAEEFFALPDDERRDLVNGEVIVLSRPGAKHGKIAGRIFTHVDTFVQQHQLGDVYVETGFVLARNPDTVRGPDVSFLEAARLPQGETPDGLIEGAPTLAVEVVSPNDAWDDVEDKVALNLAKGTRAVWLVRPRRKSVSVRTADAAPVEYGENDILPGGDVLPGFELPLKELFA